MPFSLNHPNTFNFKLKPYSLFGVSAIVLLLISFMPLEINKGVVDVNLHDSYFVIAHHHLLVIAGIFMLFIWAIYLISHSILLSEALIWLHFSLTLLSIISFLIIVHQKPEPRRYYAFVDEPGLFDWIKLLEKIVAAFVLAQIAFAGNILAGVIRHIANKNRYLKTSKLNK